MGPKTLKIALILLAASSLLSGCWDRLEIEDRAVILGLAIDKLPGGAKDLDTQVSFLKKAFPAPPGENVRVTAQIAVPGRIPLGPQTAGGGGGGGQQKPVWVLSANGHTIDGALMNLQQQIANRLFFGHLRVIVIGEKYARAGTSNLNDYLRRNSQIRRTAWLVVSKGRAEKLMKISPELERVPALYLLATMDHAVELGKFPDDFLGNFWSSLSAKGTDPYLPYVTIKKGENVEVSGAAYFRGEKMVGVSEPLEVAFLMVLKNVQQGGYTAFVKVPKTSGYVMFHATRRKTRIHVEIRNGRPYFIIQAKVEGNFLEKTDDSFQVADEKQIRQIEEQLNREAKKGITQFIQKTQNKGSDIFGFGEYVRAKCWRFWNQNIHSDKEWSAMYKDIGYEVHTDFKIRRVGMKAN